jgi:hypothetical protein
MSSSTVSEHATINAFRMMERLGVEPAGGVMPALGLRYATMLRGCAACTATPVCNEWLARPALSDLPPRFCPCSDLLFELQFDQPGYGRHDCDHPGAAMRRH